MTPIEEIMLRIPVVTLLLYVPFICYADLKWREIPFKWWLPLLAVDLPILIYFNYTGYFPPQVAILSLIMVGMFWVMHRLDFIQGSDFIFLAAISLFFVVAPFPVPHWGAQILFYLYLIAAMIFTAPVLFYLNYRRGFRGSFRAMVSEWPGGIPLILPISAALLMTVVLG